MSAKYCKGREGDWQGSLRLWGGWLRTFAKDSLDVDVSADIGAVAILEDIIAGKQFQSRREMSVVVQIGRREIAARRQACGNKFLEVIRGEG